VQRHAQGRSRSLLDKQQCLAWLLNQTFDRDLANDCDTRLSYSSTDYRTQLDDLHNYTFGHFLKGSIDHVATTTRIQPDSIATASL
jgi:hypothetical protein